MGLRQAVGDALIALAVAFAIYISIVMVRRINAVVLRDSYVKVFRYELMACALFLLFALDIRFGLLTLMKSGALKAVGWVLRVGVILAVAALLFLFVKISAGSLMRIEAAANNAIVLGLALENGEPTGDLLSRLDTAEAYLRRYPASTLILTGGNPDESGRTEAAVMRELLVERGVAEDKLVLEDRAETTKDNFRNTARMIDPGAPVVLITSDYHMDRAVRTAKGAGFSSVLRLPAPSSPVAFVANVMWEVMLELNEMTLKR